MPGGGYAERVLVRLLFSAAVLFLSLRLVSSWGEPAPAAGWQPASGSDWSGDSRVVTFYLREYQLMPYARVVVNGEVRGGFTGRYLTVAVHDGDSLALDGTFYNRPISVEVLDVSSGVKVPRKGEVITLKGNVVPLGRVEPAGPKPPDAAGSPH